MVPALPVDRPRECPRSALSSVHASLSVEMNDDNKWFALLTSVLGLRTFLDRPASGEAREVAWMATRKKKTTGEESNQAQGRGEEGDPSVK